MTLETLDELIFKNFVDIMLSRLQENKYKGTWLGLQPSYLSMKLTEEFSELQDIFIHSIRNQSPFDKINRIDISKLIIETADLSNVSFMIYDNLHKGAWIN